VKHLKRALPHCATNLPPPKPHPRFARSLTRRDLGSWVAIIHYWQSHFIFWCLLHSRFFSCLTFGSPFALVHSHTFVFLLFDSFTYTHIYSSIHINFGAFSFLCLLIYCLSFRQVHDCFRDFMTLIWESRPKTGEKNSLWFHDSHLRVKAVYEILSHALKKKDSIFVDMFGGESLSQKHPFWWSEQKVTGPRSYTELRKES